MTGAMDDNLDRFCCQNPECPDYGQRGRGNLRVGFHYGKDKRRRMLVCRTCQHRFSERKGTPLFDARLPDDKVVSILAHLRERCGVRQTGRLAGVGKNTVVRYALRAGGHAQQLHDELVGFSPRHPRSRVR
jgi:LacI family transcriptional regulator